MKIELAETRFIYTQDRDDYADNNAIQQITIERVDAGAGKYYVIKADRWAFDSIDEFVELLKKSTV